MIFRSLVAYRACWSLFIFSKSSLKIVAPEKLTIDEEGATVHGSYGGRLDLDLDLDLFIFSERNTSFPVGSS